MGGVARALPGCLMWATAAAVAAATETPPPLAQTRAGMPQSPVSDSYGEFHIYRIDPHKASLLCQDAMQAVKALVDYLREQLVTNDGWLQSP